MARRPPLIALLLLGACAAQPSSADPHAVLQEVLQNYRANLAGMQPTSAPVLPRLEGMPIRATQLLGQSPSTLRRWLGEPSLRRKEGEAQIWLFQTPFCHLDVVLDREDAPGSPLRVSYAAARAAGTERRTEAACLSELERQASL
ncbi:hypothetical protein E0493_15840 [Roseomonas sp. M0104]|uniref:Outer membrane protein assembly factor BamE n=1 Tax=Teichococcus coralli TaxID=2545983 RepID=A0A845BFJ4_9PROT|nr:hypothetical protein [Pseudoroseomonas coralli]MXP64824.1 hypothetical protein [Pseudoroseomonas coralli]